MKKSAKNKLILTRLLSLLVIVGIVTGIVSLLISQQFFYSWHLKLSNFYYSYRASDHTSDVVVVSIDDKSLQAEEGGGLGRWNDWQRSYYAQVIENLNAAGASVIGVDVFFSQKSNENTTDLLYSFEKELTGTNSPSTENIVQTLVGGSDQKLVETLSSYDNVVLAGKEKTANEDSLLPFPELHSENNTTVASVSVQEDPDNLVRSVPLLIQEDGISYGFALELVRKFFDLREKELTFTDEHLQLLKGTMKHPVLAKNYGPLEVPLTKNNNMYVNYVGMPYTIPQISFVDVYNNTFDPELIRGKILLIGEMASGIHDDHFTPVSFGSKMPGVEIHANAIETLLYGLYLSDQSIPSQILTIALLALILGLIFLVVRPVTGLLLLIGSFIVYFIAGVAVFTSFGLILNTFYPLIGFSLTYILCLMTKYFFEERTKRHITKAFSHYVSEKLVDKMVEDPDLLRLGGEKKEMTVLFTDIAGFTTLSEKVSPEELVDFLTDYLSTMTKIILRADGTLDKYIGDAIMAFWGAPVKVKEHHIQACDAAYKMHHALEFFLERWADHPDFQGMAIRTGIASGDMIVGNIGASNRFDYTVIGDIVNLGSRLEGVNKVYNTEICVSESTYEAAKSKFAFRLLDKICVKGKVKPIKIYELIGPKDTVTIEKANFITKFEEAFSLYQKKHFKESHKMFLELAKNNPEDGPTNVYIERLESYLATPPAPEWNGVFALTSK